MAATFGENDPRDRRVSAADDPFRDKRARMVASQIAARGIRNQRVLAAMERVPRHRFVPDEFVRESYDDHPVPIGADQTISQPYIVGFMVDALELPAGARVLEIGTGSGYQAAVLAEAGFRVWTIEIVPSLALAAEETLRELGYDQVQVRHGDGTLGWPEDAPFDGIIVAAAPREVPPAFFDQLAMNGSLVVPIGGQMQDLWRYRRTPGGFVGEELLAVRFVPMTGGPAAKAD